MRSSAILGMAGVLMAFGAIEQPHAETLAELGARLGKETNEAYAASRFSVLSRDYFARLDRDPLSTAAPGEVTLDASWTIATPADADPVLALMAGYLNDFLKQCMGIFCAVTPGPPTGNAIVLASGADLGAAKPESFRITTAPGRVTIAARETAGIRDGIVRFADELAFRGGPFLTPGEQTHEPRLRVRLGATPYMGTYRDLIFFGFNAVQAGGGDLYALSPSNAIPELASRRVPGALEGGAASVAEARRHGLRTYAFVNTREKFPEDHPVFQAHPDIRGARVWREDGEFVLCTEHPLVQRWLEESVEGLFRATPGLDGLILIVGGEGFYHCFMRPFGVEKGHTNCPRCEALGPDTVVANLCNRLATTARRVNPEAEILAWPYSAEHVWSSDIAQTGFIGRLGPGCGIFTEIEKSAILEKPEGVQKSLWDYSIDLTGPCPRALEQIAACKKADRPIYLKSEPELGFEAPRLPHIPCMDRWADRAIALADSGASGAWVFPAFRPFYGATSAEVNKLFWWNPAPDKESTLQRFAARLFGPEAGPHAREAWRLTSEAIAWSPELPSYYTGPYYLGPAHPMCVDPAAKVPEVFYGRYLFHAEIATTEGMSLEPVFVTSPTGNVPVFGRFYREMERLLAGAVAELDKAQPLVPERCKLMFDAESIPLRWFYHTARTETNFYESCQIRDALAAEAAPPNAKELYARWRRVLEDELDNARAALPLAEADMRLDCYYGGDHTFSHMADMVRAKIELLAHELDVALPAIAAKNRVMSE